MTEAWNGRPPAPLDAVDGWHWLKAPNGLRVISRWNSYGEDWSNFGKMHFMSPRSKVQRGYTYHSSVLTPEQIAAQIAEAVKAEREACNKLIRSLAVGYERMSRALHFIRGTSGIGGEWYRRTADTALKDTTPVFDLAWRPVESKPGECLWINREGSMDSIRARGDTP